MSRAEIKQKFDEIVAFAEIGDFIDTPVKHYSSGMYMRLAFAVAAHLETEILIVDEVLAVGDLQFQEKCLGKMSEMSKLGRTIIFVSHNMGAIENLCTSALVLNEGTVTHLGNVKDIINSYMSLNRKQGHIIKKSGPINITFKITSTEVNKKNVFQSGESIKFKAVLVSDIELKSLEFGLGIEDIFGSRICTFHSRYELGRKISFKKTCEINIEWKEIILTPGKYRLISAVYNRGELIAHWDNLGELNILEGDFYHTGKLPDSTHQGNILIRGNWDIHEK